MAYTTLMYHLVFSTKERVPLLKPDVRPRIYEYMGGIIRNLEGSMISAGGTDDHVHIATIASPKIALMEFLQKLKGNSSKWIHETFPDLRLLYWQDSYGGFTVSPSELPKVLRYIRNQEQHHKRFDFRQEFLTLLQRHGVKYDERYLWR